MVCPFFLVTAISNLLVLCSPSLLVVYCILWHMMQLLLQWIFINSIGIIFERIRKGLDSGFSWLSFTLTKFTILWCHNCYIALSGKFIICYRITIILPICNATCYDSACTHRVINLRSYFSCTFTFLFKSLATFVSVHYFHQYWYACFYLFCFGHYAAVITAVTELGHGKPKFYSTAEVIAFCRKWRLPTNHVWLFSTRCPFDN